MKLFKNYSFLMLALVIASGTLFTGCVEDPCAETICFNDGSCNEIDGSCDCTGNFTGATCEECAEGWQGVDCDEEIPPASAAYTGTYDVIETCNLDGTDSTFEYVSIIAGDTEDENVLNISNFWDLFENPVVATITGDDIVIASQDPDSDGFTVFGTGLYNDVADRVEFTFTITDTVYGDSYSCIAWYTLQ